MFELSDPGRGLLEQTQVLRFRLKFARYLVLGVLVDTIKIPVNDYEYTRL
jgi:hypothetical protein